MIRCFYVTVTYTLTAKHMPSACPIKRTVEFAHKLNMLETDHTVFTPLVAAAANVVRTQHGWGAEDVTQMSVSWEEVTDEVLRQN